MSMSTRRGRGRGGVTTSPCACWPGRSAEPAAGLWGKRCPRSRARRCTGWWERCCPGSGSGRMSCCAGPDSNRGSATNDRGALMRSAAAPDAGKPQGSLPKPNFRRVRAWPYLEYSQNRS